jgi:hypothetical protein
LTLDAALCYHQPEGRKAHALTTRLVTLALYGRNQERKVNIPPETMALVLGAIAASLRRLHRDQEAQDVEAAYRELIWQSPEETLADAKANTE